jgi:hypothetical protein
LPVAVTLKRLFASDLVFSLGIWLSYGCNTKTPGAAITLTCGWIKWRLPPTRSSQGIASGCPDRHQASTPRNFLEKLIVVSAAERAASYFGRAVQLVKVWCLETRIHASGGIQS